MSRALDEQQTLADTAFLLGAGRSGTTLLYKLLCLHPKVAYVSNYEKKLSWLPDGLVSGTFANRAAIKRKAWFDRGNAYFVSRPWVKRLVPTPVEGEFAYAACGVPLVPEADYLPDSATRDCLSNRFEKIRVRSRADVLVSKRTANNRRVPTLRAIFPNAKYVHLIRDGRDVAHSLSQVEWWDDHVLWWDGRTAKDAEASGCDRLLLCASNWVHEIAALTSGMANLPEGQVLEIRYEDLLDDPEGQLTTILNFLGIPVTETYLTLVRSLQLSHRPPAWSNVWSHKQLTSVLEVEQTTLRQLGYIN
jgi:hypothetical protein